MLWISTRVQTLGWRMKDGAKRIVRGEAGQTSSEYLVIAGVVVAILVAIFATFSDEITSAFETFTGKVTDSLEK